VKLAKASERFARLKEIPLGRQVGDGKVAVES